MDQERENYDDEPGRPPITPAQRELLNVLAALGGIALIAAALLAAAMLYVNWFYLQ